MSENELIQRFMRVYAELDGAHLDTLDSVYADTIAFVDPFHRLQGLAALKRYLAATYSNAREVRFQFDKPLLGHQRASLTWELSFRHPRLNRGRTIHTPGISLVSFDDTRIHEHRDYYDGGALLYEHIPLLGAMIRALKQRLQTA